MLGRDQPRLRVILDSALGIFADLVPASVLKTFSHERPMTQKLTKALTKRLCGFAEAMLMDIVHFGVDKGFEKQCENILLHLYRHRPADFRVVLLFARVLSLNPLYLSASIAMYERALSLCSSDDVMKLYATRSELATLQIRIGDNSSAQKLLKKCSKVFRCQELTAKLFRCAYNIARGTDPDGARQTFVAQLVHMRRLPSISKSTLLDLEFGNRCEKIQGTNGGLSRVLYRWTVFVACRHIPEQTIDPTDEKSSHTTSRTNNTSVRQMAAAEAQKKNAIRRSKFDILSAEVPLAGPKDIESVAFRLHPSFNLKNPNVEVTSPPFAVSRTGWGGFRVGIVITFRAPFNDQPMLLEHDLDFNGRGRRRPLKIELRVPDPGRVLSIR